MIVFCLVYFSTLKKEATGLSVDSQRTTGRYIPDDKVKKGKDIPVTGRGGP
jgi:hypothetical protein